MNVSAQEIEQRAKNPDALNRAMPKHPPLTGFHKHLAGVCFAVVIAGVALERFTYPPMVTWYFAITLIVGGGIPLWILLARNKAKSAQVPTLSNDT